MSTSIAMLGNVRFGSKADISIACAGSPGRMSAIGQKRTSAAYFMYRMEIDKPIAKPTQ